MRSNCCRMKRKVERRTSRHDLNWVVHELKNKSPRDVANRLRREDDAQWTQVAAVLDKVSETTLTMCPEDFSLSSGEKLGVIDLGLQSMVWYPEHIKLRGDILAVAESAHNFAIWYLQAAITNSPLHTKHGFEESVNGIKILDDSLVLVELSGRVVVVDTNSDCTEIPIENFLADGADGPPCTVVHHLYCFPRLTKTSPSKTRRARSTLPSMIDSISPFFTATR